MRNILSRNSFIISLVSILCSMNMLQAQILDCDDQVNIALSDACSHVVTPAEILQTDPANPASYKVEIFHNGINIGNTLTSAQSGAIVSVKVTYLPNNNFCNSSIWVEDNLAPSITCPAAVTIDCNQSTNPYVTSSIGLPTVTDCSTFDTIYQDVVNQTFACPNSVAAIIKRKWTATDAFGKTSTCNQNITIERTSLADVTFPPNFENATALSCVNPNTDPSNTGYPLANGLPLAGEGGYCMLIASKIDQVFPICANSYKIIRKWTIYDWCQPLVTGTNPLEHTQVIMVSDTQKPTLNCPADVTVSTGFTNCTANLMIPAITASDLCSGSDLTYQVSSTPLLGTLNSNGGILPNAGVGTYTIKYTVTDDCNNSGTCTFKIKVEDQVNPVAICEENTVVAINSPNGTYVMASVFDQGSYDNCCLKATNPFEVRRMTAGSTFGPDVFFTCADVGSSVIVTMKVWDCNGNSNTCMVNVVVQDKINPTISCPPNTTISCSAGLPNLNSTIGVNAYDNCGIANITVAIDTNLTQCGNGNIVRIFTATDVNGKQSSCSQTITVTNSTPFNGNSIVFPNDVTITNCGGGDTSPSATGSPTWPNNTSCAMLFTNKEDVTFDLASPACFKIQRIWTIVDMCQNPNIDPSLPGIWRDTQYIMVYDNIDPVLTLPNDITFNNISGACSPVFVTVPDITVIDCSNDITIINSKNANGANASGLYPIGTTTVKYTVLDGCGNVSIDSLTVTVLDKKEPSIVQQDLTTNIVLMPNGPMAMVFPEQFIVSVNDNCTAASDIKLSFSADVNDTIRIFDCNYLGVLIPIDIWATDESGNNGFVTTNLLIQDNNNICTTTTTTVFVAGAISTETMTPVENADVNVYNNSTLVANNITATGGAYSINNLLPNNNYLVQPFKNTDADNGVSTIDILLISRHILGVEILDSPYKLIAADANHSNSISAIDMVQLRQIVLHNIETFPQNNSWRFIDSDFEFPNPQNPWQSDFPEIKQLNNLNEDVFVNFTGIKIGDVNNSAISANLLGETANNRSNDAYLLNTKDIDLQAGQTYDVFFDANNSNIEGAQFTLDFDPQLIGFETILAGSSDNIQLENFGLNHLIDGAITASWNGTIEDKKLFGIRFQAMADGKLSDALKISSRYTQAEAYNDKLEINNVAISFDHQINNNGFALYQNQPNPSNDITQIGFELPEAGEATLTIYDLHGRLLKSIVNLYPKGFNNITLDCNSLGSKGVFYYTLTSGNNTATKKLVVK